MLVKWPAWSVTLWSWGSLVKSASALNLAAGRIANECFKHLFENEQMESKTSYGSELLFSFHCVREIISWTSSNRNLSICSSFITAWFFAILERSDADLKEIGLGLAWCRLSAFAPEEVGEDRGVQEGGRRWLVSGQPFCLAVDLCLEKAPYPWTSYPSHSCHLSASQRV